MALKTVRVEIQGQEEYIRTVKAVVDDGKKTMGQILLESAVLCHKLAVDSIRTGARSGRTYFKTKSKIPHKAAAAGEPPKSDSGVLIANITLEKEGDGYTVGSRKGAPHGFWQEFGTAFMKAHPWLTPAFNKMIDAIGRKYK